MARSGISSTSNDIFDDNGATMISVVRGEQLQIVIQIGWVTNLNGYNVHARLVEGINAGGGRPTGVKPGGITRLLTKLNGFIRDVDDSDNTFKMVIPYDLCSGMSPQPVPDQPVYMYLDLEVGEPGTGPDANPLGSSAAPDLQVWKPVRGLVEISYSPTEV
jgi:hypothetical protein